MILIKLRGDKVIGVIQGVSPSYKVLENEVLIEDMPPITLSENEKAHIYFRDGRIMYERFMVK